jgi:dTDP-4-amino-4,6-dideoxygalactose transaminase
MSALLAPSIAGNHYANSGPASKLLERSLHDTLDLPDDRAVVVCSSCSTGLQVAAGLAHQMLGRGPRPVTSVFTFFSFGIGHYQDATRRDCSAHGGFDPNDLRALNPDTWDTALFTNTFAAGNDEWAKFRILCEQQGKVLIVDNAIGLLDRPKSVALETEIEVISLHHTKPWGVGEGGAIIVSTALEAELRSLLNFGARSGPEMAKYATNGKMSDIAAAAILERLERIDHWRPYYDTQHIRMRRLLSRSGLALTELGMSAPRFSPVGSLQFLAPHAVPLGLLATPHFAMRKYYRPLGHEQPDAASTFPTAHDIYDRILCVPCHPYMRELSDDEILTTLEGVLKNAAQGSA